MRVYIKSSFRHFPATHSKEEERNEELCFNGVADKREERPGMEARVGREHHNLSLSPSPSSHHHLLHRRALALPLLLLQLQQADGEDHGGHEAVHLPATSAPDLPGPVGLRQRWAHDAISATELRAQLGPNGGWVLLGGGGSGGADATASAFPVEFPVQVVAMGVVL